MKKILITLILLGLVVLPGYAVASAEAIRSMLDRAETALKTIGGGFIVIMVVYAGILFVTGGGEPEKISKAKQALLWAVIGGIVLLGVAAFKTLIEYIAGATIS